MNYLSVDKLSKSFGDLTLFEGISFGLERGEKTALIANNGTGKSTLFNILAGSDTADEGKISLRDGIELAYLQQNPVFDENLSIQELLQSGHSSVYSVIDNYQNALEAQSKSHTEANQRAFEEASNEMDVCNAWDFERRIKQIFTLFRVFIPDQIRFCYQFF